MVRVAPPVPPTCGPGTRPACTGRNSTVHGAPLDGARGATRRHRVTGMPETWTFTAPLWRWNAKQESTDPGSWSFVTLPTDVAEDIRDAMVEPPRGFGSVKVQVVVGEERWSTSVFPDKESDSYVLPVKQAVRRAVGI